MQLECMTAARIHWPELLLAAAGHRRHCTSSSTVWWPPRSVPNTTSAYKGLSSKTAEARHQEGGKHDRAKRGLVARPVGPPG